MKYVDIIEYLLNLEEWNEFVITNEFGNLTLRSFPSNYIPKFIIHNTLDKLFEGSDYEVRISGNEMLDRLGYFFESLGNYLVETSKEFNNNKFPELFLKISKLVCLIEIISHMIIITPKFDNDEKEEEQEKISKLVCLIETKFHMIIITPKFDNDEKENKEKEEEGTM